MTSVNCNEECECETGSERQLIKINVRIESLFWLILFVPKKIIKNLRYLNKNKEESVKNMYK